MRKQVHFRDEIRDSLISYALIPGFIFAVIVILSAAVVWMSNISRHASSDCKVACTILDSTIRQYVQKVDDEIGFSPSSMVADRHSLSLAYSQLKEFTRRQKITANFVILDKEFQVVLQGNAEQTFRMPEFQQKLEWGALERMRKNPESTIIEISQDYTTSGQAEIIIGKALLLDDEISGFLLFIISGNDVQDALRNISSSFVITDKYGEVFETTSRFYLDELGKLDVRYLSGEDVGLTVSGDEAFYRDYVYNKTLVVYTIISIQQMKTAILILCLTTLAFLTVLSLCMVFSASKIAAQRTKTIDELVCVFREVENGLPQKYINIKANVEFQTIADAYNKMLDNIKDLIEKNKHEVHEKYLSEIKQLEMQFNPHFLYNTLETIKYLIRLEPDSAVKTIVSLSELLRYSINGEVSLVTLESDMMYIENYLEILKQRFNTRFNFSINIDDDVKNAVIPKLIIQPVIENSVKYGFDSSESMDISVLATYQKVRKTNKKIDENETGYLIISVTDNGVGMSPSDLTSIRRLLKSKHNASNHIGLHNVQRRIQLVYGEQYGLTIKSNQEEGTTVTLRLPCVQKNNDKHTYS